jgi:hypothetical protein
VKRLAEPHVETRAVAPEAGGAAAPPVSPRADGAVRGGPTCAVVLWRDVPAQGALTAAVARHAGCAVEGVHAAGGSAYEEGGAAWARLAAAAGRVVVVAEAWEAPDKAALRLLGRLREALGPRRHVLVLLVDVRGEAVRAPSAADVRLWEEGIARLEDPYLAVEPLRGAP